MFAVAHIITGLCIVLGARAAWYAGAVVRHSTLAAARWWSWVALAGWGCAWCLQTLFQPVSPARTEQLWYAVALLSLCPLLSSLGARRPGNRIWNLFVLLPMLAVLGWPALTVWISHAPAALRLEAPTLVGFALVMMMGAGNYIGTRFTLAVCLLVVSLVLVVAPLSAAMGAGFVSPLACRQWAMILLGIAAAETLRQLRDLKQVPVGWNRVWSDFRDLFGIVWANRLEERIRHTARDERWALSLGPRGFEPLSVSGGLSSQETEKRRDHTLRWLLRRFVDPEWIELRLGHVPNEGSARPGAASRTTTAPPMPR